jgi:hypothetical protein
MAQGGVRPTCPHSRQPSTLLREPRVPERIDASMDSDEAPLRKPLLDLTPADAQNDQVDVRHDTPLSAGQLCDP